jgi:hypothetical protein
MAYPAYPLVMKRGKIPHLQMILSIKTMGKGHIYNGCLRPIFCSAQLVRPVSWTSLQNNPTTETIYTYNSGWVLESLSCHNRLKSGEVPIYQFTQFWRLFVGVSYHWLLRCCSPIEIQMRSDIPMKSHWTGFKANNNDMPCIFARF